MARFILIDHSLKGVGGHHYEYAVHILAAAELAGYQVTLATHRRFRDRHTLPKHWPVYPVFRFHTYSKYSMNDAGRTVPVDPGDAGSEPAPAGPYGRCLRSWHRRAQWRRINHFAAACWRLFRHIELEADDQVFLPTLSDFDLVGLIRYLRSNHASRAADWHLQFHFNFLDGREHEYADQTDRIVALREHFARQLRQVPDHRLHFYSTTRQMADQYNRMEVRPFEVLPYPVNASNRDAHCREEATAPLRVTCAGGIRPEKGQRQLAPLVHQLWNDLFAPGRIQLLVQSKKSRFRVLAADRSGPLPMARWPLPCDAPLVDVPHPLNVTNYARLMRESHIGLFLYDARKYYARCAGILVEMLMAGVPVIVPAGCWLAEQIAEPIRSHLDGLRSALPVVHHLSWHDVPWHAIDSMVASGSSDHPRPVTEGKHRRWMAEQPIPARATDLQLVLPWPDSVEAGTFLRVDWQQLDATGGTLDEWADVVGRPRSAVDAMVHLPLMDQAQRVRVTIRRAYDQIPLALPAVAWWFLSAADQPGGHAARGRVGLIAAEPRHVPTLLREMVTHYRHYAATAAVFSRQWGHDHDPSRTVSILAFHAAAGTAASEPRRAA